MHAARRWVGPLLALLLVPPLARFQLARFAAVDGRDLYQYWEVGAARRLGVTESPYAAPQVFASALEDGLRDEDDLRLQQAKVRRRHPVLNQTPLLYAVTAALPARFKDACFVWYGLQTAALLVAMACLALAWGGGYGVAAFAWIVAVRFYGPVHWDHMVGNVNALQLGGLAVPLAVTARIPSRSAPAGLGLGLLGAVVLLKPTIAAAALGLALSILARLGSAARVRRAALIGGALLLAVAGIPCLYLRDPLAWPHWLKAIAVGGLPDANVSVPYRLTDAFGWDLGAWTAVVLLGLVASLAAAIADTGFARQPRAAFARIAACPWTPCALGILAMMALSPLVWPHYHVLLILPFVSVLHGSRPRVLGLAAVAFSALVAARGLHDPLLPLHLSSAALRWCLTFAWLPPWLALLPHVSALARGELEPSPALARSEG